MPNKRAQMPGGGGGGWSKAHRKRVAGAARSEAIEESVDAATRGGGGQSEAHRKRQSRTSLRAPGGRPTMPSAAAEAAKRVAYPVQHIAKSLYKRLTKKNK
jgi:hypothetical protein